MHCLISGRVQGVFFRAKAKQQAAALGLHGYARNLPDGRVDVLACGPAQALAEFKTWLHRGSERAEVHAVECDQLAFEIGDEFAIE
jgi:acylphosphatase